MTFHSELEKILEHYMIRAMNMGTVYDRELFQAHSSILKLIEKYDKCNWRNCPIRFGFEIHHQGEEEEKDMRKSVLPLIKKYFKSGKRITDTRKRLDLKEEK